MNEEHIQNILHEKILTYNDLTEEEFEKMKMKIMEKEILSSTAVATQKILAGIIDIIKLKKTKVFYTKSTKLESTRFRISFANFCIPSELNQLMEYFLSRNLNEEGLFKKSASYAQIQNAMQDFRTCIENNINLDKKLAKYNLLVVSSVFKESLTSHEDTIIPIEFVEHLCIIKRANISKFDRIIALRYLFLHLPIQNLNSLQSIIVFLRIIHKISSLYKSDKVKQISFAGFASVITPRLILGKKPIDLTDLRDLSDIMVFAAEQFDKIISICEVY